MGKLGNKEEWQRSIWEKLVTYANAPESEVSAAFTPLLNAGMDWIGGEGLDGHGNLNDLALCFDIDESRGAGQLDELAVRYQPKVRELLMWLSDPSQYRALGNQCAYFLMVFGADIQMEWAHNAGYRPGQPLLTEAPDAMHSVLSPVCRFLKDQIDRHDNGGESLKTALPIALCDRPGCGRFRIVKVSRDAAHVFCSNLCKATFHQAAKTKNAKAEYMREYRGTVDRNKPKIKAKTKGGK